MASADTAEKKSDRREKRTKDGYSRRAKDGIKGRARNEWIWRLHRAQMLSCCWNEAKWADVATDGLET